MLQIPIPTRITETTSSIPPTPLFNPKPDTRTFRPVGADPAPNPPTPPVIPIVTPTPPTPTPAVLPIPPKPQEPKKADPPKKVDYATETDIKISRSKEHQHILHEVPVIVEVKNYITEPQNIGGSRATYTINTLPTT